MSIYKMRTVVSPKVRNPDKPQPKGVVVPMNEDAYAQLMLGSLEGGSASAKQEEARRKNSSRVNGTGKTGKKMRESEKRRELILKKMVRGKEYKVSELVEMTGISRRSLSTNLSMLRERGLVENTGEIKLRGSKLCFLWRKL